ESGTPNAKPGGTQNPKIGSINDIEVPKTSDQAKPKATLRSRIGEWLRKPFDDVSKRAQTRTWVASLGITLLLGLGLFLSNFIPGWMLASSAVAWGIRIGASLIWSVYSLYRVKVDFAEKLNKAFGWHLPVTKGDDRDKGATDPWSLVHHGIGWLFGFWSGP